MKNTISNTYLVEFDQLSPEYAQAHITAPSQDAINVINSILNSGFSYFDESVRYTFEYEEGWIDGIVKLYSVQKQALPIGLIPKAKKYLQEHNPNIKVKISDSIRKIYTPPNGDISEEFINRYIDTLKIRNRHEGVAIKPYAHQIRLILRSLNGRRISLLACTSAGKSLSMYVNARYLTEVERKKILIIVPSTNLVEQLFTDFRDDYGWDDAETHCTRIYSDSSDKLNAKQKRALQELKLGEEVMLKNITISTWQSLQNKPKDFFKPFTAVMVDEAHGTRGSVLRDILKLCVNSTEFKIGLSGTLPDDGLDNAWIEGSLGRKEEIVRLKELIALGILTPVEVHRIIVPYEHSIRPYICRSNYQTEYALLTNNDSRKKVMELLIDNKRITTEQNTVMLYKSKTTLEEMHEYLKAKYPQFKYHIIKGEIETQEREDIRRSIEKSVGNIIIATYGTMKQGVNIKLLHNLVFAEFSKSMYEVVQSIGRIVRPHKDKKLAVVYDICDDASYYTTPRNGGAPNLKLNYSMKHAEVRCKYYAADEIPVQDINLSGIYIANVSMDQVEKKKDAAKKKAAQVNPKKKTPVTGKGAKSKFLS